MISTWFDDAALQTAIERATGGRAARIAASARRLSGGLDSAGVAELTLRYVDERSRPRVLRVVAKRLQGAAGRELAVYEQVVRPHAAPLAPRLLHVVSDGAGVTLLLEAVRPDRRWPWRDVRLAALPLQRAATLHTSAHLGVALPAWDYDAELEQRAGWTLEALARLPRECGLEALRPFFPAARRVGSRLRSIRRELCGAGPLPLAVLHGDLHPGNAMVRRSGTASPRLALLDWGRARVGSPLEDVSSWLTSIGYWEPAARRRHDTLLGAYLAARGLDSTPTPDFREGYWLAGASNAFSGALLHHVQRASDRSASPATRASAAHASRDWLRVIRRAGEVWSAGPDPAPRGGPDRRSGSPAPDPRPIPCA
jgi:hypothetical protein